jgi:taurine dioxygenase
MEAAYAALPEELKQALAGRSIKHDGFYVSSGKHRPGTVAPATGDIRDIAGAVHPIVRTHPVTGRKSLYLGNRFIACVMGLELAQSERCPMRSGRMSSAATSPGRSTGASAT